MTPSAVKTCSRCKVAKVVAEFASDINRKDKLSYWCRQCSKDQKVEKRFGLTPVEYEALLAFQGGGCAVCHKVPKPGQRLAVDHSHRTGRIRGLLCTFDNYRIVGAMRDNVERVAAVYAYMVSPPADHVFGERYMPADVAAKKRKAKASEADKASEAA